MSIESVDTIIVGQGLAGTALAWHLIDLGERVILFDPGDAVTSSKIAAGLLTPITGKSLGLSWRDRAEFDYACAFYRRIERRTGRQFFFDRTAIRLLADDSEQRRWQDKSESHTYQEHLLTPQPCPLIDPAVALNTHGGFAMRAAQLDTATYLAASRAEFEVVEERFDWARDVAFEQAGVIVRGRRARRIISCEGFAVTTNPWFAALPFRAAKGEILTLRLSREIAPQTLHRRIWVAPGRASDQVLVGASHNWEQLDTVPTEAGRSAIERDLKAFFHVPYDVIDHRAAVRPILRTNVVRYGLHPREPRLGLLNGLASKGSLRAPWHALQFTRCLAEQTRPPHAHDIAAVLDATCA